jgi:uracil-DNA glycosylase
MDNLLTEIKAFTVCVPHLELGPNPILTTHPESKIVLIGQAPRAKVHKTSILWDDKSGESLRNWMGIDEFTFYNPKEIALIPMGFCYPGKGKSGDLPTRKECAPLWHESVLSKIRKVHLTILVGQYAQG